MLALNQDRLLTNLFKVDAGIRSLPPPHAGCPRDAAALEDSFLSRTPYFSSSFRPAFKLSKFKIALKTSM